MMTSVETAILEAWDIGQCFDLSDCLYGTPHWAGAPPIHPYPYYFFLAGIAHSQRCRRVLEIGTHMGGSILSIRKGVGEAAERIVTIDPTDLSDPVLASYSEINKIQGNATDPAVISQVIELFGGNPIDLLYIDAFHDYEHTIQHYGIFVSLLRPRVVVMDDIFLNSSMRKMWLDIRRSSPKETSDTTVVSDMIRNIDAGFGVRIIGKRHTDVVAPTVVSNIDAAPFRTCNLSVDASSLSNPTEQMISLRACWLEASELFAPIVRLGSAEAAYSQDRRLCIFADTASSCVYASTFAQEPGKEMICTTPPGSFPRGRTCQISVRASTALGYLEIQLDGSVTRTWWEASGRMCTAEPRILIGAPSVRVAVEEIQLNRLML
jgi:predicted O-methyltransferase YrrM